MQKKLARFIEDCYYTVLIYLRAALEWLHILHAPSEADIQRDTDKMMAHFVEATQDEDTHGVTFGPQDEEAIQAHLDLVEMTTPNHN